VAKRRQIKPSQGAAPAVVRVLEACGLPKPEWEYPFHPDRNWRADLAWPDYRLLLEIHGGAWTGGRHTRGKGFRGDLEKQNAAICLGWRVLCYLPEQVGGVACLEEIATALALGGWVRGDWKPGQVRIPGLG